MMLADEHEHGFIAAVTAAFKDHYHPLAPAARSLRRSGWSAAAWPAARCDAEQRTTLALLGE
jgi:hypothetical protein